MRDFALWQGNVPAACQIYCSYWVKQQPSHNDFTVLLRTRGHNRCSVCVCVSVCTGFALTTLFLTRLWPQTWALHMFSICPSSETFLPSGLCMFSLSLFFFRLLWVEQSKLCVLSASSHNYFHRCWRARHRFRIPELSQTGSVLKTGWCNDSSQSPNHPSRYSHAILLLLRTYNR